MIIEDGYIDEFQREVNNLNDVIILLNSKDHALIVKNQSAIESFLRNIQAKTQAQREFQSKKSKLKALIADIQQTKSQVADVYEKFSESTSKVRENCASRLLNPEGKSLSGQEVIAYAAKISQNIQAPRDYWVNDRFLPMSFSLNKISLNEIDASILNFRYKQNKSYKKCQMPFIKPLNDTEKNIMKNFRGNLRVKNFLYLQAAPSDEDIVKKLDHNPVQPRVIYTSDGSNPSIHNCINGTTDLVYISKDTLLKFRTIRNGYIDSDILEVNIEVEEGGEAMEFSPQNMVRPNFNNFETEGSVDNQEYNEDLFYNDNFVSWHENGNYATPRTD